jgi:hypothetical protein
MTEEEPRRWTRGSGQGRLDANGVEWFACDPYPYWYRWADGHLWTRDKNNFPGWADESEPTKGAEELVRTNCTGAWDCEAGPHIHGCYADYGSCDNPQEHHRAFDALFDAQTEEPLTSNTNRLRRDVLSAASQATKARGLIAEYEQGPPFDMEAHEQDVWRTKLLVDLAHEVPSLVSTIEALEFFVRHKTTDSP